MMYDQGLIIVPASARPLVRSPGWLGLLMKCLVANAVMAAFLIVDALFIAGRHSK